MKKVLVEKAGLSLGGIADAFAALIDAIIAAIVEFFCTLGVDLTGDCDDNS
jgi:hypothetical protein